MQARINKMNEPKKEPEKKPAEDDPFAMIKKKKVVKVKVVAEGAEDEDGNSSARKSSKKGKKKKVPGVSSNSQLGLKDDGTVPKVIVKENNEAVDLLKLADDKLKRVLEMYVPPKGSGSEKSKASSRRSKSSTGTQKS
jgi:hypothetical protein